MQHNIFFKFSVQECLVAYLSFDVVDLNKKTVYDEGPYGNDFTYNGDVKFLPANYSCQNAASIEADGDLYYSGSGFTTSPEDGATIAMWVHPADLLHKQSIFTTKTIGSKGGMSGVNYFKSFVELTILPQVKISSEWFFSSVYFTLC